MKYFLIQPVVHYESIAIEVRKRAKRNINLLRPNFGEFFESAESIFVTLQISLHIF